MDEDLKKNLQQTIDTHRIVLFMKGTKTFPQCGFSGAVVETLKRHGAEFKDVNVLADPSVRQGMKDFSNWPTFPQLYVDGKFVGGADIIRELDTSGELSTLLTPKS